MQMPLGNNSGLIFKNQELYGDYCTVSRLVRMYGFSEANNMPALTSDLSLHNMNWNIVALALLAQM